MTQYLTKEGLEKLKKELEYLKKVKRKEIAQNIQQSASFGDLRENFAYQQAKEDQAFLEGKILELEKIIHNAKIIDSSREELKNEAEKKIRIGLTAILSQGNEKQKFQIVGRAEADPAKGKISFESPLGQALLGKLVGDEIELDLPEGKIKYKIVKIE